jgi:hypothetical protein
MALLEVKGITKRFGGLVAVDKLSFEVNENEIISIYHFLPLLPLMSLYSIPLLQLDIFS